MKGESFVLDPVCSLDRSQFHRRVARPLNITCLSVARSPYRRRVSMLAAHLSRVETVLSRRCAHYEWRANTTRRTGAPTQHGYHGNQLRPQSEARCRMELIFYETSCRVLLNTDGLWKVNVLLAPSVSRVDKYRNYRRPFKRLYECADSFDNGGMYHHVSRGYPGASGNRKNTLSTMVYCSSPLFYSPCVLYIKLLCISANYNRF